MHVIKNKINFVLGSSSPRRKLILIQSGIKPDIIFSPNIKEDVLKNELPLMYVKRMAKEKMDIVKDKYPESIILTADTIVYVGRRILPKTMDYDEAKFCLNLLSGRRHKVTTAFNVSGPQFVGKTRYVSSIVKFKRLSYQEITFYLDSLEWQGKAGGYAIQGLASRYIDFISGSYTNVVGLPLAEVYRTLISSGLNL